MYQQDFNPVSDSLGLTAIVAALPLICLFVLLGGFKLKAQWAALAGANSSGGVLGKMILAGKEGNLFRKVLGWSLVLILAMCALVYLQSTAVLDWMVVK